MKVNILRLFSFVCYFFSIKGMESPKEEALINRRLPILTITASSEQSHAEILSQNQINIYVLKLIQIFQRNLQYSEKVVEFFRGFNSQLRFEILSEMIKQIPTLVSRNDVLIFRELISCLAQFIDGISYCYHLFELAKLQKHRFMRFYFHKLNNTDFDKTLIARRELKGLSSLPTYQALHFICIYFLNAMRDELKYDFSCIINLKSSLMELFKNIVSFDLKNISLLSNLSPSERNKLGIHFFGRYLVENPAMVHMPNRISLVLSLIYDNHAKPFGVLGYKGWRKRIRDLSLVFTAMKQTCPIAMELSREATNLCFSESQVGALYCLNYQMTRCLTAVIIININTLRSNEASRHLAFLLVNFGRRFFMKAMENIFKEIKELIEKTDLDKSKNCEYILKIINSFDEALYFAALSSTEKKLFAEVQRQCIPLVESIESKMSATCISDFA